MPRCTRAKRVTPAEWRMTKRPLVASRRTGPGVGDHTSPVSSSRMNHASAVGSATGSFANDVSRFSRLFSDQVCDAPEAVTIVPKLGIRDDVHPRRRRLLLALQHDDVGAPVVGEAA